MKGGKFIAQGSFGCVYSPNFRCDVSDRISKNKISKFFDDKKAMDIEIREAEKMEQIDPSGRYFYKIYKHCVFDKELNKKQIEKEDFSKCNLKNLKYMLIGSNAGPDLSNVIFNNQIEFDNVFKNIVRGLVKLKTNNLVHRDIKPANLTQAISNGRGLIIDYGLVTDISKETINKLDIQGQMEIIGEGSPLYMPMEHAYVAGLITMTKTFSPTYYFKMLPKNYSKDIYIKYGASGNVGQYLKNLFKKKYENIINNNKKEEYILKYLNNFDKVDIYALGLSMLKLIHNNKLSKKFKNSKELIDLLTRMIEPDIDIRLNAKQVLKHKYFSNKIEEDFLKSFDKQLQKNTQDTLKQFGGKKKIRKHCGINKKTGKLKKGFKYSNKKLKSGLFRIIKK